ncbi:EAL domain-containing protein [Azospira restricta]|uniref:EAL domain-containing protein n=2 Tax=Azospira restricta TaxID=404405 RepID=A0A974SSJ8_9RHOO|nr:EAL domain-containing protein [Azospira restricta]
MLSQINRAILRSDDPQGLYGAVCRIAIECGGFALAWVSLLDPASTRAVPVAAAGLAPLHQLKRVNRSADDPTPTLLALRDKRPVVVNDTRDDPRMAAWRELTEQWNVRSGGAFPIYLEGEIIGAFNVAATEPNTLNDREVNLLVEVADDLSFALEAIRRDEKRVAAESKMRYLAYYDTQTGLPSRELFEERLAEACQRPEQKVAVLVADLRHYHSIMQSLGAGAGQDLVRAAAARLETAQPTLPVARVAEAMFAVMLCEPDGLDVVEELAWSIHKALAEPVRTNGREVLLDPFVGIAVHPQDSTPAELLKHAMQAATDTAHDVSGHCRFFIPEMDDGSRRRLDLDTALRRALEREEFTLHYQPQVGLASGRVVGAEALLRWQRPGHGQIAPNHFIALLEDSGLIGPVGEWVLHEACRAARRWLDAGLPPLRIAVNVSARQFRDHDIRGLVRRALDATGLEPQRLELELTESAVLRDADKVIRTMHELNDDGLSHALDDFGTGYSSLSYLQRLPVARIKIDRSFVSHITSNPGDAAIARAVVGMAHSLGLSVIAEGVETEGQLGFLNGIGCEEIQGYYFSRPLPENEFVALLREGRCIPAAQAEKPERVLLLVDDEPNVISALKRLLRGKGYRIEATTSTREGFDLMATQRPGVVICDQRMPEMTGTEFLRRVKELHPETLRIVLSGYTELNSVIDAVNQGAVYKFLTKPWEDKALCDSIQEAFRIYELARENRELTRLLHAQRPAGLDA